MTVADLMEARAHIVGFLTFLSHSPFEKLMKFTAPSLGKCIKTINMILHTMNVLIQYMACTKYD